MKPDTALPDGWLSATLGQVARIDMGQSPPGTTTNLQGRGLPLIGGASDLGVTVPSPKQHTSEPTKVCETGDLILCIRATIGKVNIADGRYCLGRGVAGLRATAVDRNLLRHYLRLSEQALNDQGTGSTFRQVNKDILQQFPIQVAPLNEQRRIVAKIEELTDRSRRARVALDAVPALLDRFRQSILAAAFRGDLTAEWRAKNPDVEPASVLLDRIRKERRRMWDEDLRAKGKDPRRAEYPEPEPVDESALPGLPEGWCWVSWRQVGDCQNGRAFPSQHYQPNGEKLLRPGNLHVSGAVEWTSDNTQYMPESWAAKYPDFIVGPNELVINLTAQSLKDEFLGRVCLTGPGERCLLNQRIARLSPTLISPRFSLWLMKAPIFRKYVDSLNTGSLIQHMFTSQIYEFVFPLPPLEEQAEIVRILDSNLASRLSIQDLVTRIEPRLGQLDQSILAKAFRGELVPQDPNDEFASVLLERMRGERVEVVVPKARRGRKSKAFSEANS